MSGYTNKRKSFNDPIYGFISIPNELCFDIIEHKYFQRLRRISQLGLTNTVYPGAYHTRFHHALGAMHLMGLALNVLKGKGVEITPEEEDAARLGILLHDIGHGPFSHALENSMVSLSHEKVSTIFMDRLNEEFGGALDLCIKLFKKDYHKTFLCQLIASQLDVDRLDYLRRDSFYTGVSEGVVPSLRLIHMMNVKDQQLVIDAKGVYSVEKFLVARRLMYWQVYLHKTVLVAEFTLLNVLKRAKELAQSGVKLFSTSALAKFLHEDFNEEDFKTNPEVLEQFSRLDDFDIMASIKEWIGHSDKCLSELSKSLINRKLGKIELSDIAPDAKYVESLKEKVSTALNIPIEQADYFVYQNKITNSAYQEQNRIMLLNKQGELQDVAKASDQLNLNALSQTVEKHFVYYPKHLV